MLKYSDEVIFLDIDDGSRYPHHTILELICQEAKGAAFAELLGDPEILSGGGYVEAHYKHLCAIHSELGTAHCGYDGGKGTRGGKSDAEKEQFAENRKAFQARMSENRNWRSTKIDWTIQKIKSHLQKAEGKVVVFSEYICVLDLVELKKMCRKRSWMRCLSELAEEKKRKLR